MKRFTFTLVAALIAVVSFAQLETKSPLGMLSTFSKMSQSRTSLSPAVKNLKVSTTNPFAKKVSRKAPLDNLEDLQGDFVIANHDYTVDDEGHLDNASAPRTGFAVNIEVTGENTIMIYGMAGDPDKGVSATVDITTGMVTIPTGQVIATSSSYGDITLENAEAEGDLIAEVEDGIIIFDQLWYEGVTVEGTLYAWSDMHYSMIAPSNATMEYESIENDNSTTPVSLNVLAVQYAESDTITIFNFANGYALDLVVYADSTFDVDYNQILADAGENYGTFQPYGFEGNSLYILSGTGTETTLTADLNWIIYSMKGYVLEQAKPFTITLTDGSSFAYPQLEFGELLEAPANLETEDYPFTATIYDVETPEGSDYATTVKVGWVENDVYIQGLDKYHPEAWVKGTLNEDSEVVIPVTYTGETNNTPFWLAAYGGEDGPVDLVLDYDATSKTFDYSATVVFYAGTKPSAGFNYYLNGFFIGQKPLPTAAPEDLATVDMPFKGNFYASVEEDEPEEVTGTVKVGFTEAGEVYIQNLFAADAKDGWIKGFFYEEDPSLVIFPLNQLVGISTSGFNLYLAGYYKDPEEEKGGASNVIFSYDAVNNFFEALNPMMLSRFKNSLNYECFYEAGLVIGDVPEAVEGVKAEVAGDNSWFNIGGQRVAQPTKKGLYIHNGKKVVVK